MNRFLLSTFATVFALPTFLAFRVSEELCQDSYNDRFNNKTMECARLGSSDGCGLNQIFFDVDGVYGECDCSVSDQCEDFYIYWPPTDNCYVSNTQGPCDVGQWLVLNGTGFGTCQLNPCPQNDGQKYVHWVDGQCYRFGEQGPCTSGYKLIAYWEEYYYKCTTFEICGSTSHPSIQCYPASKWYRSGFCNTNFTLPTEQDLCKPMVWDKKQKRCLK